MKNTVYHTIDEKTVLQTSKNGLQEQVNGADDTTVQTTVIIENIRTTGMKLTIRTIQSSREILRRKLCERRSNMDDEDYKNSVIGADELDDTDGTGCTECMNCTTCTDGTDRTDWVDDLKGRIKLMAQIEPTTRNLIAAWMG